MLKSCEIWAGDLEELVVLWYSVTAIDYRRGGVEMAYTTRFGKPNMTNLPSELGKAIFQQILNTPKPNDELLEEEARVLEREMIKVRNLEDAQRKVTK